MRKMKTCWPSHESTVDCKLKSIRIFELNFSGCSSSIVGLKCRPLSARKRELQIIETPVGQYVTECKDNLRHLNVD